MPDMLGSSYDANEQDVEESAIDETVRAKRKQLIAAAGGAQLTEQGTPLIKLGLPPSATSALAGPQAKAARVLDKELGQKKAAKFKALIVLVNVGKPLSSSELAERLGKSRWTVHDKMSKLRDMGFVDEYLQKWRSTQKGRELVRELV